MGVYNAQLKNKEENIMAIMMAFNEQVQEDVRRMEEFDNIMQNAKPLMTIGQGKNMKVITATSIIPLHILRVDSRYQGMRSHPQLDKLRKKWDIRKLTPIIVVAHFEDGTFYIVDGQGRFKVAPEKGIKGLPAIILMDAPEDPEERLKFEAAFFIAQDSEVEAVRPVEKHLARCILGDYGAVTLDKLMKQYGISFTNEKGQRDKAVLGSYSETYKIANSHGEQCLDFIFSIIENVGWNKESNGYAVDLVRAFRNIWYEYRYNRNEIHSFLSRRLRHLSPQQFVSESRAKYPNRGHSTQTTLLMEDLVCDELRIEKRYYKAELEKDKRNNKH